MCPACSLGAEDNCAKGRPGFAVTLEQGRYPMRQRRGQAPGRGQMGRGQQVASIYLAYSEAVIRSHPRTMDISSHQKKNLELGDSLFTASNMSSFFEFFDARGAVASRLEQAEDPETEDQDLSSDSLLSTI